MNGVPEDDREENPGAFVHFNLDNDNSSNNSVGAPKRPGADYLETTNPVTGEDDLKSLTMTLLPLLDFGSAVLSIPSGAKIWKSATKGSGNLVLESGSKTWDLSVESQRNEFYSLCSTGVFVEGVNTGSGNIVLRYINPPGAEIYSDTVKYTFIAADCGDQPRTEGEHYPGAGESQRAAFERSFPLKRCEWSIIDNRVTHSYNCIAFSVDEYIWYNPSDIDWIYGDKDYIFEDSDMDDFYDNKKVWSLISSGTDEEKANRAEAMYYSYGVPWNYGAGDPEPGPGYHAARRYRCMCELSSGDKWIIYESKCGPWEMIEHIWDQLNGSSYGNPDRFYK